MAFWLSQIIVKKYLLGTGREFKGLPCIRRQAPSPAAKRPLTWPGMTLAPCRAARQEQPGTAQTEQPNPNSHVKNHRPGPRLPPLRRLSKQMIKYKLYTTVHETHIYNYITETRNKKQLLAFLISLEMEVVLSFHSFAWPNLIIHLLFVNQFIYFHVRALSMK